MCMPMPALSSTALGSTNAHLYAQRYKNNENINVFIIQGHLFKSTLETCKKYLNAT